MKKNILILILTIAIPVLSFANDGWTLLNTNITQTINSLYFTDVNTGYAVANSGTIIKTSNSGSSWSPVSSGLTVDLQKVYFTSSSVGYILSEKGQILSTQTSGASWTSNTIYDFSLNGISFYGSKGIVVGDAGFVSTTVDGTTWTNQNILGVYTVNDVLLLLRLQLVQMGQFSEVGMLE